MLALDSVPISGNIKKGLAYLAEVQHESGGWGQGLLLVRARQQRDAAQSGTDLIVGAVGQLQFDVVAYRLKDEYKVEAMYEPVNVYTARWISCDDPRKLEEFRKKASEHLSIDGGGHLTYLAPTRVNLSLMEERWPELEFRATREH